MKLSKSRVRRSIVSTFLLLIFLVVMAVPAIASEISMSINTNPLTPNIYRIGDTIHYTMSVGNPAHNAATNTLNSVELILPDGSTVVLATNLVQAPGVSNPYYYDYIVKASDIKFISGSYRVEAFIHASGIDSLGDSISATEIGRASCRERV